MSSRAQRWEARTVPLILLAVAFLIAHAWPVLDPSIDRTLGMRADSSWDAPDEIDRLDA